MDEENKDPVEEATKPKVSKKVSKKKTSKKRTGPIGEDGVRLAATPVSEQTREELPATPMPGVTLEDVTEVLDSAVEQVPAKEQDLAVKLAAKMKADALAQKRKAIEAEDAENLFWIQCRSCSQPGAFFDRNPNLRHIKVGVRYDKSDPQQVGVWNRHKPLHERQMNFKVACQACDRNLDFLHSSNEMRPYRRFTRRTPKSSLSN